MKEVYIRRIGKKYEVFEGYTSVFSSGDVDEARRYYRDNYPENFNRLHPYEGKDGQVTCQRAGLKLGQTAADRALSRFVPGLSKYYEL